MFVLDDARSHSMLLHAQVSAACAGFCAGTGAQRAGGGAPARRIRAALPAERAGRGGQSRGYWRDAHPAAGASGLRTQPACGVCVQQVQLTALSYTCNVSASLPCVLQRVPSGKCCASACREKVLSSYCLHHELVEVSCECACKHSGQPGARPRSTDSIESATASA